MDANEGPGGDIIGTNVDMEDFKKRFTSLSLPGEETKGVFGGAIIEDGGHASCGSGRHFLIVTNKRVIFSGGEPGSEEATDFFVYSDITSAESKKGFVLADVILQVRGAKKQFGFMQKSEADKAVGLIVENIQK